MPRGMWVAPPVSSMRSVSIFVLLVLSACSTLEKAAAKDPRRCETDPDCAKRFDKSRDCATQCADDSECMKRCEMIQSGIDR